MCPELLCTTAAPVYNGRSLSPFYLALAQQRRSSNVEKLKLSRTGSGKPTQSISDKTTHHESSQCRNDKGNVAVQSACRFVILRLAFDF
jgi:hypothetical protein